jgi:hypothetical protein
MSLPRGLGTQKNRVVEVRGEIDGVGLELGLQPRDAVAVRKQQGAQRVATVTCPHQESSRKRDVRPPDGAEEVRVVLEDGERQIVSDASLGMRFRRHPVKVFRDCNGPELPRTGRREAGHQ